MSWIRDSSLNWFHLLFVRLLRCGRVPEHVAFIMDGNRRYARKNNVEKLEGHSKGFDKLSEVLQWCLDLGIPEVTVYAFSIENFKRSEEEVNGLMELARGKFKRILLERETLNEHGVKIRVIGNLSLLPPDIRKLVAEVELITKDNNKAVLNVAFSYTAQDEMTYGTNLILNGLANDSISTEDLNLKLFSKCLYTRGSKHPELIIRTSGETRLSDFLLFQGSCSYLYFADVLWPELSAWDLLWAVFKYQHVCQTLDNMAKILQNNNTLSKKGAQFLKSINENHINELHSTVKS
ncbi:hypothetical protein AAG570_011361 [Ranatra chinensis]|uniref:Alkyl transferase n=1 Tax=Ranatra chinensis TaxID=642074 RepID=A0ABD0YKE1_9HEMI